MFKNKFIAGVLVVLFGFPAALQAQSVQPDTSFLQIAKNNAHASYQNVIGMQALLYNGTEYRAEIKSYLVGHAYFESKAFEQGTVVYDGVTFENVPLLYDVVLDELITVHPTSGLSQKLVKEKISTFGLPKFEFVHLKPEGAEHKAIKPGLYSMLYDGDTKAFHRREKSVQERATAYGMEGKYKTSDKFYILKDGVYHAVGSKGSVLNVFRDEKKQLKKFIRENSINYSANRPAALAKIAAHYDSLKN